MPILSFIMFCQNCGKSFGVIRTLKKILAISMVFIAISIIPSSFAWDGLIAIDADKRNVASHLMKKQVDIIITTPIYVQV